MNFHGSLIVGATLNILIAAPVFAVPIQIDINKGVSGAISFRTDSSDLTVTLFPDPDPSLSGSFVTDLTVIFGPDPGPPAPNSPLPPVGNYLFYQSYDFSLATNFLIADPLNFTASGNQITFQTFTYQLAGYEIRSDGTIGGPYQDTFNGTISSIAVSTLNTVPLPATAPLFGVSLAVLGIAGFRLKRRTAIG